MNRYLHFSLFYILIFFPLTAYGEEIKLKLDVTGLSKELKENVESYLSVRELKKDKEITVQKIKSAHRRAKKEILQALQPFGYYQPKVSSKLVEENNIWYASYKIEQGPATLITQLNVKVQGEGEKEKSLTSIAVAHELKVGERLEHSKYKAIKKNLYNAAFSEGYLDAEYAQNTIKIGDENQQAEITLILDTGPKYYFGAIFIEQEVLSRRFVKRYIEINEGDAFDSDKLLDLKFTLTDSGYFNDVEVIAQKDNSKDYHIPVVVRTHPAKPRKYSAGVGFGTDTGPRGNLGVEFRRFNKRGHKANINIRASAINSELSSQYTIPIRDITKDQFAINASASDEEFADGDGDSKKIAVGMSQNVDWFNWRRKLYVNLDQEDFTLGEDKDETTLLYPGITLSRSKADDALFTRKGYSLSIDFHGGVDSFLSDTSFFNTRVNTAGVLPITTKSRLLLRGQFGVVDADDFSELPPSQRFFAGGDRSVRGYDYQDIGPRDDNDENVGGKYLYAASIETDYLVYKNFGAAIFFDAGNAEDELSWDPQRGAGVGFRWASPVGMARLDFAFPLDGDDRGLHFHISIGPDL